MPMHSGPDFEIRGCRVVVQPNPLESFLVGVTEILREEVDELVRLGCEYIQLDAPHKASTASTDRSRVRQFS
jgi:methionine synthase II (cobalamin-independent)